MKNKLLVCQRLFTIQSLRPLSMIAASLGLFLSSSVSAVTIQIPNNTVDSYADIQDVTSPEQNHTTESFAVANSANLSITAIRSTNYLGTLFGDYGPIQAGDFVSSGWASLGGDATLSAYTSIIGTVGASLFVTSDSEAEYYDDLKITEGSPPATVVFHLSLHGVSTGMPGGVGWTDNLTDVDGVSCLAGAMDLTIWYYDPTTGAITGGRGYGRLPSSGDGSTTNMDISVPWAQTGNDMVFELDVVAFGRVVTSTNSVPVTEISDFSQTGRLLGVSLFDASGNDITSATPFTFARASTRTPVTLTSPQISGANITFQFPTVTNQTYRIEQNDSLDTTNWTMCTNIIGSGTVFQFSAPLAGQSQRYFRVAQP